MLTFDPQSKRWPGWASLSERYRPHYCAKIWVFGPMSMLEGVLDAAPGFARAGTSSGLSRAEEAPPGELEACGLHRVLFAVSFFAARNDESVVPCQAYSPSRTRDKK